MSRLLNSIVLALLFATLATATSGFVGCQGVVKASEDILKNYSDPVDFSKVTIQLIDSENYIVDEFACSPKGLFVIPLYNIGEYTLKLANVDGWTIYPQSIPVSLTSEGTVQGCSSVVSFVVSGFTVDGKVLDIENVNGIENVDVTLTSPHLPAPLSLKTDATGSFVFTNLLPDTYTVQVSHPTWTISSPSSTTFTLSWDNYHIQTPFHISGYSISGSFVGKDVEETLKDIQVQLVREDHQSVHCEGEAVTLSEDQTVCYASLSSPAFQFNNVRPGQYILSFTLLNEATWSISPLSYPITIESDGVALEPFTYSGYIKTGRVVDNNGNGVDNVKITTNAEVYYTDKDGYYTLRNLKNGQYTITAEKKHLRFTPLTVMMTTTTVLPSIVISSLHVCGSVNVDTIPSYVRLPETFTVFITDNKNIKKQVKTNNDYHYCFNVEPGEYIIYVDDKDLDIKYTPNSVIVENQTFIMDSNLVPIFRTIQGTVDIREPVENVLLTLTSVKNADIKYTFDSSKFVENAFLFTGVLPSAYTLSVQSKNTGCWNTAEGELVNKNIYTMTVDCTEKDVSELKIENAFYAFEVHTSLPVAMTLSSPSFTKEYNLVAGKTTLCLNALNAYALTYSGCITSQEQQYMISQDVRTFDIDATVRTHSLHGSILFNDSVTVLPNQVTLLVSKDNTVVDTVVVSTMNKPSVEYTMYLSNGSYSLSVDAANTVILYSPLSLSFEVKPSTCNQSIATITAEEGLIVSGKIIPPLSNVQIKMFEESNQEPLSVVMTDANGEYHFQPISKSLHYTLEAYREGHHFQKSQDGTSFTHKQLSSITIFLKDQNENPIPDTVLTLSGDGYMNTYVSRPDGSMVFGELFPSSYTLMMNNKEYSFTPSIVTITLNEGEAREVSYTGTKIAYSIYGSVLSLSGAPLSMFTIEAKSPVNKHRETAVSDEEGHYRIRGLKPSFEYVLSIKMKEHSKVDHFIPSEFKYSSDITDIHDATFIAIYKPDTIPLEGVVEGLPLDHQPFNFKACAADKTCQTIDLRNTNSFLLKYKHETTVTITPIVPKNEEQQYICDKQSVEVKQGQLNTVTLHCQSVNDIQSNSSVMTILSFVLVTIVTLAVFYYFEKEAILKTFKH